MFKIIIGAVVVTVLLLVVMSQVDAYSTQTVDPAANTAVYFSSEDDQIAATITGEVVRPGTYYVDDGSSLQDLIMAASGITSNADQNAFDVTYTLTDNISFYIAPLYDNTNSCSATPIVKVNVNSADKAALMSINAIGDTLANSIISYREENHFYRIEDLKNVNGIGTATFEKIKNYVTIK